MNILSTWFNRYFSRHEAVALLAIMAVSIVLLKLLGQVLTPIIISVVLAYLLSGLVRKLESWHVQHLLAVLLVFLVFIGFLLLVFLWLLPILWWEGVGLIAEIPTIVDFCQEMILKLHGMFPEVIITNQLQQVPMVFSNYLANFGKEILTFSISSLFGIVTLVIYLVLVPILVFFLLRDSKVVTSWLARFLPHDRKNLNYIWHELHNKIRGYVGGKIVEATIITIVLMLIFTVLQLRYAVLFSVLAGLSVMVPYVGFVVVTIPLAIVGMVQWGLSEHFFYFMGAYFIVSMLDANLLVPFLFAEVMNLHPLSIVLGILVFGGSFGFWGVFFAIPLVTLINILLKFWPRTKL